MSIIAILVKSPVNTLVAAHLTELNNIQIQQQRDGSYILHGESSEIKELLKDLRLQILQRKANARSLDSSTAEYYQTNLQALQDAISCAEHVEFNLSTKP